MNRNKLYIPIKKELSSKDHEKISFAIVACHLACFSLEEVKHTTHYNGQLKRYLNLTLQKLIKAEKKEIDVLFDKEEQTTPVVNSTYDLLLKLSKVNFIERDNFSVNFDTLIQNPETFKKLLENV